MYDGVPAAEDRFAALAVTSTTATGMSWHDILISVVLKRRIETKAKQIFITILQVTVATVATVGIDVQEHSRRQKGGGGAATTTTTFRVFH